MLSQVDIIGKGICKIFFLFLIAFLCNCKGPEGDPGPAGQKGDPGLAGPQGPQGQAGMSDKQVRLAFPEIGTIRTNSVNGTMHSLHTLNDFNINYYPGADSVVFGAYLLTNNPSANCIVELYDRTNNNVIQNSQITSNSSIAQWTTSKTNFIKNLPNQTISLGIRVRTDTEGVFADYYIPLLFIYRK